jgi:hypothetical protein
VLALGICKFLAPCHDLAPRLIKAEALGIWDDPRRREHAGMPTPRGWRVLW